jgi:hypothetical protein
MAGPSRVLDQPQPGCFRLRLVRGGPFVGACIKHALGFWSAEIDGQPCGAAHADPVQAAGVCRIWNNADSITAGEYALLLRRPPVPADQPVNLATMPPVEFPPAPTTEKHVSMNAMTPLAGYGRNMPEIDLAAALEPEALAAWLAEQYAACEQRRDDLLAANTKFQNRTADGIKTPEIAQRATDFERQLSDAITDTEAARVRIKAPVLAAQRAIDGAAHAITDPLEAAAAEVKRRVTVFMVAADAERLRVAAETARRAEAAAWHLSQQAERTDDPETYEQAGAAMEEQQAAAAIVAAPTAERTRMRSALGTTASLRDRWEWSVADVSQIPAMFMTVNEKLITAMIKNGTREIPGIKIVNTRHVGIR